MGSGIAEGGLTPPDLEALAARVESGSGADRELDSAILDFLNDPSAEPTWPFVEGSYAASITPPLTASLDAVVRLIEEKLPGAYAMLEMGVRGAGNLADVSVDIGEDYRAFRSEATTPARALLAAALRAMKEEGR